MTDQNKPRAFPYNHLKILGIDKLEPYVPVVPRPAVTPVVPVNRWILKDSPKSLVKTYQFKSARARADFIIALAEHEISTKHPIKIVASDDSVDVSLVTKGIEDVTEVDYECAKYFDLVFRDLISRTR